MSAVIDRRAMTTSPEAEQSVLGDILTRSESFDAVADILDAKHFADHGHAAIWSAVASLIVAHKQADVIAVFDLLKERGTAEECGGIEYLSQLAHAYSFGSRNLRRHAELIVAKYQARALLGAASEAMDIAQEDGSVGDKVDRITSLFGAIQSAQVRKVPRAIADIAIDRIQVYEDLKDGKVVAGWRTHIPWLTTTLNGGLRAGGLYILAARPSVGKSSFTQELGMQFAVDDLPTLFLSQEMAETEVADRGVANLGRLSYSKLLTGEMGHEDWSRASEAMERMGKLPFFVDDQASLTLRDIRIKAKSCKGLKILILDYLQLCASTRKDGNRNSEIEEISRGLKSLAKELGIAIIALSQLNRDVEKRANKRPSLSDLRDSGAIEQDADVVMFLWPVRDFPSEGRRIVGLGVDKNRQGRLGQVGLDFYGDVQRWTQSTADINPEPMARKTKDFE
jgi:replicative DNA helicase